MTSAQTVPTADLVRDFRAAAGKSYSQDAIDKYTSSTGSPPPDPLTDDQIDSAAKLLGTMPIYAPCQLSVVAELIYFRVLLTISNGDQFSGDALGFSNIGGGVSGGHLYTSDYSRLTSETHSFVITEYTIYAAVYFHNKHRHLLGYAQCGGIGTADGIAPGKGHWILKK